MGSYPHSALPLARARSAPTEQSCTNITILPQIAKTSGARYSPTDCGCAQMVRGRVIPQNARNARKSLAVVGAVGTTAPPGRGVSMAGMPHPPTIAQTGCPKILCASVASVGGYLSKKYLCASVSSVGGLLSKKHLCASVQSVGGPYTPKLLLVRCILWEYAVAAWLVQ